MARFNRLTSVSKSASAAFLARCARLTFVGKSAGEARQPTYRQESANWLRRLMTNYLS